MYMTNYSEEKFLNVFRGVAFSAPPNTYLALFLNNPTESGGGIEINYAGYERLKLEWSEPAADEALGKIAITNTNDATFATSPISAGTITYIGVMDSKQAGNMLLYGKLEEDIVIEADEAPVIVKK